MKRRRQGTGTLFPNGKKWYMQFHVDGKCHKEPTGCLLENRAAAEEILKRRVAEANWQKIHDIAPGNATIADLYRLVEMDQRINKHKDDKNAGYRWRANLEARWGKIKASRLGSKEINLYIEERRAENAADSTINRELAVVKRGYRLGLRTEPALVIRVPYFPHLKEDNVRQGFLEPDEYERLLEKLPFRLKALFVCAYHVGARKGQLRLTKWEQIDWDANLIRFPGVQTKAGKQHTVPIFGDMRRWLDEQVARRRPDNPYVFFGKGKYAVCRDLDGWEEACKAAGREGLLFHDLRRSAVRNLKRAGVHEKIAMDISGHRTRAIFDRYDIVDEDDLTQAGAKAEAYAVQRKRDRAAKLRRVK